MKQSRSDRLKPVVKLAGHREKTSAKTLGESRNSHNTKQNQLRDLEEYRSSYAAMLQQKAQQGISSGDFCLYQDFLQQIDHAIIKQKQALLQSNEIIKENVKGWKLHHRQQKAMEKMTHRIKTEEHKSLQNKQQREVDDEVNLRHRDKEKLF